MAFGAEALFGEQRYEKKRTGLVTRPTVFATFLQAVFRSVALSELDVIHRLGTCSDFFGELCQGDASQQRAFGFSRFVPGLLQDSGDRRRLDV